MGKGLDRRGHTAKLVTRHLELAQRVAKELVAKHGRDVLAVGVMGSVALGEEGPFSDVDVIVLAKRAGSFEKSVRDGILISGLWQTLKEAETDVTEPSEAPIETLSGWWSLRVLYDPTGVLERLAARARGASAEFFRDSARMALLGAREDFGKVRNAVRSGKDDDVAEMSIWFSGAAAVALSCILHHVPHSGRTLFAEVRDLPLPGKDIVRLRYERLNAEETGALAEDIWERLLGVAGEKGVPVDDLAVH